MSGREAEARLLAAIGRHASLVVAVSGGVDSMTLAYIAHRLSGIETSMAHAVSPAVPAHATERVRAYAAREDWRLTVTGAGEFEDSRYRDNPVNRCYFCKSNLYGRIRETHAGTIASGANLDDLGDYRPGLQAAAERDVVHPYVEAGIGKAGIRALARRHGLVDLAELPAQPCLASRVETGIAIDADDLAFIEKVESRLSTILPQGATLRCRVTHSGIAVEIGEEGGALASGIEAEARRLCLEAGRDFSGVRPYRRGSAFLRP